MHGEKKTVLYRYGAIVTALLMLLAVFVLPGAKVHGADFPNDDVRYNNIRVSATPNRIEVGKTFSLYINFDNNAIKGGYAINLYGANVLSGSYDTKAVAVDSNTDAPTYVYVPAGTFTFDGKNAPISRQNFFIIFVAIH